MKEEIIYIQNMSSPRDILLVSQVLESHGVKVKSVELGAAAFIRPPDTDLEQVQNAVERIGFRVLQKEEKEFADSVKFFLGMYLEKLSECVGMPVLSRFLEEKMGVAYSTISKRFRKIEDRTIDKYFTMLKIGKVKSLLQFSDLTIKDISLRMNYSNPRSLARKFREETGYSLQNFKNMNLMMCRAASGF